MRLRLLLLGVAVPLVLWAALPVLSSGAPSSSQVQRKIQLTQGKIGRRKGTERVLSTDISTYRRKIGALQGRIGSLQSREASVQADLDAKRAELASLQGRLRDERARLTRLRLRLGVAKVALTRRLVQLYESDTPSLLTVVMTSGGFNDLLESSEFLQRVGQQDNRIIRTVRDAKTEAGASATRLDGLEARQRVVTSAVAQRRNELSELKQGLIDTRVGYDRTKQGKQDALVKVRGERQHLEGALSHLKAEQAKITAALQAAPTGTLPDQPIRRGSGQFIWPVNGPITSPFCERRPWEACHPGIDIGVPQGTPIHVAADGRVALMQSVGESGGYGNYTCVQHTASLSTCYAHQSRFATSVGASVKQGQVIGYTGCTGLCFGPHLHFEVRINGAVTNPINYLG